MSPHDAVHRPPVRPVRLLIVGAGVWPSRLRKALLHVGEDVAAPLEIRAIGPGELLPWLIRGGRDRVDVAIRLGLRPGASTKRGLAFDLLWWVGRTWHRWGREVFYWVGTDVYKAMEQRGTVAERRVAGAARRARHLAAAPWLCEELVNLGVEASLAYFPLVPRTLEVEPLPEGPPLRLVSYVPQDRWEFYGGDAMLQALEALGPAAQLILAGGVPDIVRELPPNVYALGQVEDFPALIAQSHALLRIVQHDALGATVIEALQLRRHVIYTYQLEGLRHVRFGDVEGLISQLRDLARRLAQGELQLNDEAASWLDQRTYAKDARVILRACVGDVDGHTESSHG